MPTSGEILKAMRQARGLTQQQVAAAVGVQRETIARAETDSERQWQGRTAWQVFEALAQARRFTLPEAVDFMHAAGLHPPDARELTASVLATLINRGIIETPKSAVQALPHSGGTRTEHIPFDLAVLVGRAIAHSGEDAVRRALVSLGGGSGSPHAGQHHHSPPPPPPGAIAYDPEPGVRVYAGAAQPAAHRAKPAAATPKKKSSR